MKRLVPILRFSVKTDLAPAAVIDALTDFGDRRPELFRNIDRSHFQVHGQGPGWAEVTEGNVLAWERSRYGWDTTAGTVTLRTIESNSWAPGSGWEYRVTPANGGGSQVEVTVIRNPRTLRGKLIGLGLPMLGTRVLRDDLQGLLARIVKTRTT